MEELVLRSLSIIEPGLARCLICDVCGLSRYLGVIMMQRLLGGTTLNELDTTDLVQVRITGKG